MCVLLQLSRASAEAESAVTNAVVALAVAPCDARARTKRARKRDNVGLRAPPREAVGYAPHTAR